ncbi:MULTISPECIES: MarR family transcriptional regulator [unclassified Rhodococcus (in: high G+C Gram-positive bacteria)]|uniref:MarR family winged helix-turn-helix transcriptional regulator n=1 Tax=Rhodococcus sp. SJ-3 TaxID=3454628 RepID=UPI002D9B72C7|nr:MarR family winged helix-turn-helix transcriptional regulator [Rhodococcus sp. (in: high G+C Gram-positive bacteria)]
MQQKRRSDSPNRTSVAEVYDEFVHLVRFLTAEGRADGGSLSLAQHSLLGFIARNPGCRATEISEVFGVNRSTVSRQVRHCIDEGWLSADSGPTRLGHPLSLTDQGHSVLAVTVNRRYGEVTAGLTGWGQDEIDTFVHLLRRFRSGVDPSAPSTDQNDGDFSA